MNEQLSSLDDEELSMHEKQISDKLEVIENKLSRLKSQKAHLLDLHEQIQDLRKQRRLIQHTGSSWDGEEFPWSAKARQLLSTVFSVKEYRPKQLATINALMSGHDVLFLAPTGAGKSLCFQLPALLSDGLTVVISPLISLMEDQVWSLDRLKIKAKLLCSTIDKNDINQIHRELSEKRKPTLKLLYVTPERLSKSKRFMTALQKCYNNGHLDRFAIDEVHCCSQWGHDFRPDYKFLNVLKEMFPKSPLLGVTATATTKVISDVQTMLNIPDSLLFVASFNRPNLYYHVLAKPASKQEQYDLITNLLVSRFRNQSGIIYTYSMKDAVDISTALMSRGLKAGPYHANLDSADRTKIHKLWYNEDLQVVVATVAFGMGINKGNVRFVIHHTLSKSMENFYQESGRAGRDGGPADCILLYNFVDMFRITTMTFSEHTGLKNAYALVKYCITTNECRRKIIAQYFSEVWGAENCNAMCDRCVNTDLVRPQKEIAPYVQQLYRIIEKADMEQMNVTGLKLVDAWMHKGQAHLRLTDPAPLIDRTIAEQIVAYLIVNGYLKESFVFTPYATLSYIKRGSARVSNNTLKFRYGKLFPLVPDADRTNGHTKSSTSKAKKRPVAVQTNGSAVKRRSTRFMSSTDSTEDETDISPPASELSPDDIVIQDDVEVIELDGD
ncbi:ATP-dependent DNA helicase Q1-like [Anopheles marshallii]|uniref:ATP-dependent DNA helicase Q1-like n=1 Tax=Anopheles marshallii TaxID=1521116 RepID=UPI00237BB02A|nr:ATP-dependent DNA helicase Q1-like [Anopheles marshallii]